MIAIFGIFIVCSIITLIEVPKLKKEKAYKEIFFFSLFLFLGTAYWIVVALRIKIPNPMDWLLIIFVPIGNMIDLLLSF